MGVRRAVQRYVMARAGSRDRDGRRERERGSSRTREEKIKRRDKKKKQKIMSACRLTPNQQNNRWKQNEMHKKATTNKRASATTENN